MPEGEEVLDAEKLNALIGFLAGQNLRKRGQRKTRMGSGKHLTFDQLKSQFGYGLKEAAGRLGICPTTLKRACRRNGIERWPCRQIAKLNKAMKSAGYSEGDSEKLLNSAVSGKLKVDQLLANSSIPASKDLFSHVPNTLFSWIALSSIIHPGCGSAIFSNKEYHNKVFSYIFCFFVLLSR